jgi:hypothetical protein
VILRRRSAVSASRVLATVEPECREQHEIVADSKALHWWHIKLGSVSRLQAAYAYSIA